MARIDLLDGKYTVINENGILKALRYGEPWRDLIGDNLISALVDYIEELEQQVKQNGSSLF